MVDGKMATQSWISDRVKDWLQKHPTAGAKEVKEKLEDDFNVKVTYNKAWYGRRAALDSINGSWSDSFQILYNFKAEVERRCPGSIVEIATKSVGNKMLFSKVFMALRPCIDGFLNGCRPYVGIDSTHLTGKFKGQLAAATGVDGMSKLFPVAFGIFDSETTENWTWFMAQFKRAIGTPPGLTISSDACKGLATAIASEFPNSEHRECMNYLMDNFKKRFQGEDFDHMWPASRAYNTVEYEYHFKYIEKYPLAVAYLEKHHKQKWCRSKFSVLSKCDYETNNISESFNSWIKDLKELHVVDLVDQIRQRLMVRFDQRRNIGAKQQGLILGSVMKELNNRSKNVGKVTVKRSNSDCAEVSGTSSDGNAWRYAVKLDTQECTCGEWQLTGKPCKHALAFICQLRGSCIEDHVYEFYSVDMFRAAYAGVITPMGGKSQWMKFDPGYKIYQPKFKRPAGRPKKGRIHGCLESKIKKKWQRCKRCLQLGHQERTCKEVPPDEEPTEIGK